MRWQGRKEARQRKGREASSGAKRGAGVTLTSVGAGALGVVALLALYPLRLPSDREALAFADQRLREAYAVEVKEKISLTPFQMHLVDLLEQTAPHETTLSVSAASLLTLRGWKKAH